MCSYYESLTFLIRPSRVLSPVGGLSKLRWMGGNQSEDGHSVINAAESEPLSSTLDDLDHDFSTLNFLWG